MRTQREADTERGGHRERLTQREADKREVDTERG